MLQKYGVWVNFFSFLFEVRIAQTAVKLSWIWEFISEKNYRSFRLGWEKIFLLFHSANYSEAGA